MNILEILNLPLYWDSAGFFFWEVKRIVDSNFTSLIPMASDYPHTPLLLIIYALFWKIFGYSRVIFRLVSILFSLATLVILYLFGRKFINKKTAFFAPFLLTLTPLFLAQTFLIYFEIPAIFFKLLSFYFLFSHQFLAFITTGLIAAFIRVENFLLIPLVGIFYLIIKRVKRRFKISFFTIATFGIIAIAWFLIHYLKTGWFFYSPNRYFEEDVTKTFFTSLKYFLFFQGRIYLIISMFLMLMNIFLRNPLFLKSLKSKDLSIFITLFFYSLIHLVFFSQLGYFLPRYILPLLPLYYLFFSAILSLTFSEKERFIVLIFLTIIFCLHFNDAGICNLEDSMRLIPHITARLEAVNFLKNNAKNGIILAGEFPEHGELTLPFWGYTDKVLNVTTNPTIILKDNIDNIDNFFVYFSKCEANRDLVNNIYKRKASFLVKEFDRGTIKIFYRQ